MRRSFPGRSFGDGDGTCKDKARRLGVVGDGRKALLLRNEGDPDLLDLRRVEVHEDDNPPSREQGTDRPGRTTMQVGPRSAIEATDWHAIEEERFAASVAERL
ncbi:MAG: host attachment protein, partial [Methylobacteriaceae bacterium]|nr:host attachment protein [Methylobacteriaceae bacterium]